LTRRWPPIRRGPRLRLHADRPPLPWLAAIAIALRRPATFQTAQPGPQARLKSAGPVARTGISQGQPTILSAVGPVPRDSLDENVSP
jgi:hypothetical protein